MDDHQPRVDLLLIGAGLFLAACAAPPCLAGDVAFEAHGFLRVERLASSYSRTSGSSEMWRVSRLVPIDRKHFLALVGHYRDRNDVWMDPKQIKKERDAGRAIATKVGHHRYALAILRRDGKLVDISDEPEGAAIRAPLYPGSYAVPLVMDETDVCPYALLEPVEGSLLCFDLDLHFMTRHRLPLAEILDAKVTFDGVHHTLWLFGARYARRPTAKSAVDVALSPPVQPMGYGIRFVVGPDSVEPIPVDPEDLFGRLQEIARDADGERLELQSAGIRLRPFHDLDDSDTFWVLIRAVSADDYGQRTVFSGTRVYFRARLSPQGLGKVEQLPVWIVQEDRKDIDIDERTAVFRFPRFLEEGEVQAFSLSGNDCALYFNLRTQEPSEDGSFHPNEMMWLSCLFGVISGGAESTRWVVLNDEQKVLKWSSQLAGADSDLRVLPMRLLNRVGRSEFAFGAACRRRGAATKVPRAPCVAFLELEY